MCQAGLFVVDYSYLNMSGYENPVHDDSKIGMDGGFVSTKMWTLSSNFIIA